MNYQDTLELCMRRSPRLFLNESDVLHHLFFVIGNGYKWHDGQLVDLFPQTEEEHQAERQHRYKMLQAHDEEMAAIIPGWKSTVDPYHESVEDEIKSRHLLALKNKCYFLVDGADPRNFGKNLYPICEYAKILNLPDDIKPDWLDAAERAIEWAYSPYCRMTESDRQYLETAKARINSLKGGIT